MRIDLAGWTREATRGGHRDFLALFETADRLGFDGVWFNEFHFQDPPQPYPSTLLLAAAVFARTERIRVGASVLVLPIHQPMLLAEEIAQLDFQSGGRIDIGLGRGTDPATLALLRIEPAQTRALFEANYRTLIDVWAGAGPPVAATVQRPYPPLYLAGYTPESLAFAVEEGLPLLLSLEPNETRQIEIHDRLTRETGSPSLLRGSSLSRYVVVGPNIGQAENMLDDFLTRRLTRRAAMAAARGQPTPSFTSADRAAVLTNQVIWGDPEQCLDQILRLSVQTGVGELRCVFNGNGVLSNDEAMVGMKLFADQVLPAARAIEPPQARIHTLAAE